MGLRSELVTEIEKKTGTEEYSCRKPELSSNTVHKIYEQITDKQAQPFKGRGWHIKKVLQRLELDPKKSFHRNGARIPVQELKKINQHI